MRNDGRIRARAFGLALAATAAVHGQTLLNTDLAESGGLRMVSGAKVLATLKEAGAEPGVFDASVASRAAQIAGAQVMLVGQVIRAGDRIILTAELADVDSGNTLGSIRKEALTDNEIFSLAPTPTAPTSVLEAHIDNGMGQKVDFAVKTVANLAEALMAVMR